MITGSNNLEIFVINISDYKERFIVRVLPVSNNVILIRRPQIQYKTLFSNIEGMVEYIDKIKL